MIGDYPNLPHADNQPLSQNLPDADNQPLFQQPLILPGYAENAQEPFLDAQPTILDVQYPLDMQQTFTQQAFLNPGHPLDMQQTFTQQAFLDVQHPLDMQQTFAQRTFLDVQHPLDMQQPFTQQAFLNPGHPLDMEQTFAQHTWLGQEQPFAMQDSFGQTNQSALGYPSIASGYPSPSERPFPKLVKLWRSDPAYKVFFIALATVLISALVCILLARSIFQQPSSSQTPLTGNTTVVSTPSPMNIPTPLATPTPTPTPTVEPTTPPTSPPASSQLNVEITSIPPMVANGTTISLTITTNEPGAEVILYVAYNNATPAIYKGARVTTNGNGWATLFWPVTVHPTKRSGNMTANVTVFARDANGQTAASQKVTVQVLAF